MYGSRFTSRFIIGLILTCSQAEITSTPFEPEINLEADRLRTLAEKPTHAMITLIARYPDGTPAKGGRIGCTGWWFKYSDDPKEQAEQSGEAYMFKADSRGAVILNPNLDDTYLHCWAEHRLAKGEVEITEDSFHDGMVQEIIVK